MSSGFLINGSASFVDDAIARLAWQRGLRSNPAGRNAARLAAQAAELRLSLLDQERRQVLFEIAGMEDTGDVKSDPGNFAYYQGIVFELLRQLGPGFTLRLLVRTLGYMIRLRSKGEGEESPNAKG